MWLVKSHLFFFLFNILSILFLFRIIIACCVLHNIAYDWNQNLDVDELADLPIHDDEENGDPCPQTAAVNDALIRRMGFAKRTR